MNTKKQRWILYLISFTILTTIVVQLYWNYKNYEQNKQRVINEIQLSLDNAIEEYYANLSKESLFAIVEPENPTENDNKHRDKILKNIFSPLKKDSVAFKVSSFEFSTDSKKDFEKMDSIFLDSVYKKMQKEVDSVVTTENKITRFTKLSKDKKSGIHFESPNHISEVKVFTGKRATDSLKLIKGLQTIFISVKNDSLNHAKVDSILSNQLKNKGIQTSYYINHTKNDSLVFTTQNITQDSYKLSNNAKTTYLKSDENLAVFYQNPTYEALKRSFTGILLSLLLSLAIIASLFYLLKVINKQKELAEIKNDLISNITHEFKTPITTVSTAIEAINTFNAIDDKEKTKKYLSISTIQLKKLHLMVEKLLETATLDSEKLLLKKEPLDIVELTEKLTNKHRLVANNKEITFSSNIESFTLNADVFHFENAISNLIDNAIKYGGEHIEVSLNVVLNHVEISVADNGKGIDKNQQEKIFDKFYRIPKGNTHDVKGFGIGLYYTKKIVEKHGGIIALISNSKNTIFKISLPNE